MEPLNDVEITVHYPNGESRDGVVVSAQPSRDRYCVLFNDTRPGSAEEADPNVPGDWIKMHLPGLSPTGCDNN
jgi:hypothetical protein